MNREKPRKRITGESTGKRVIEQSRIRLLCIATFYALCFGSIGFRLVDITVNAPDSHAPKAIAANAFQLLEDRSKMEEAVAPEPVRLPRGDVVDRNGVVLATSLATASLFANGDQINHPEETVRKLSAVFPSVNFKPIAKKIADKKSFIWIKRNLTPSEQHKVNNLGLPGLYFQPEARRIYPYGRLFSHVLGYVGQDNVGLAGIEKHFDKSLLNKELNNTPLTLSLDLRIQNIVHEEMLKAVREFNAIGATGVVVDIKTGEVLALSNLPDFDPHNPGKAGDSAKFNRATLGVYEMGSTFKTFTVAAALDYGVTTMRDGYDASHPIKVARFTISDTHPKNRWLSVPEIYAYSSNIGTVKMVLDLGMARQQEFLEKIGLFRPVELELPELATPLKPNPWREINSMTIAYGHGMAVSPMHLVRAIATITGDGKMKRLTLRKGGNVNKKPAAMVVSEKTALNIRRLMRMVVEYGTATKANAAGYRVGGKTGTAEKVQAGGRYNDHAKLASFISVFPVDDPQYVVLVMVDEPQGNKSTYGFATGGWIAAPVAGRIISRMGPLLGIRPIIEVQSEPDPYWIDTEKRAVHAAAY